MRCVIARVFPVPAPAMTQTGPRVARATARCSLSSAASISSPRRSLWLLPVSKSDITDASFLRLLNRQDFYLVARHTKIQSFDEQRLLMVEVKAHQS